MADGNAITVYVVYVLIATALTAWLARTLFRSVVGFYMLNLGYALYILRAARGLDAFEAVQFLVNRLAILLVTLAGMHFLNVLVFWRIRARREQRMLPAPVAPQVFMPPARV